MNRDRKFRCDLAIKIVMRDRFRSQQSFMEIIVSRPWCIPFNERKNFADGILSIERSIKCEVLKKS
jgi:hypothetical protein